MHAFPSVRSTQLAGESVSDNHSRNRILGSGVALLGCALRRLSRSLRIHRLRGPEARHLRPARAEMEAWQQLLRLTRPKDNVLRTGPCVRRAVVRTRRLRSEAEGVKPVAARQCRTGPRSVTLKRLNRLVCLATMLALAGITSPHGDDSSTIDIAADLGSVIESEQACGLTYDRDAIERFITEHVKASDMSFPSTLDLMTVGTKVAIKSMSQSSLTAHCTQIRRIAKEYGFIK